LGLFGVTSLFAAEDESLFLSLDCVGSEQSLTVVNHSSQPLMIRSIQTWDEDQITEVFGRQDLVPADGTMTYTFGGDYQAMHVADQVPFRGNQSSARVLTSDGTVAAHCSTGMGSLALVPGGAVASAPEMEVTAVAGVSTEWSPNSADQVVGTGGSLVPVPAGAQSGDEPSVVEGVTINGFPGGIDVIGSTDGRLLPILPGERTDDPSLDNNVRGAVDGASTEMADDE